MSTQTIRQIIARSGLDAYNEEISAACDAIDAQIAKLEQQGESVASIYVTEGGAREFDDWRHDLPVGRNLLYTHPAADLTDEQIDALADEHADGGFGPVCKPMEVCHFKRDSLLAFARAIIAKVKGVE